MAIAIPASPHRRRAIIVAIEEAKILTKLLPISMTPINWSVLCRSLLALWAPLWPLRVKCLRRYRFKDIMPVSELEKKPERMIRINRMRNNNSVELSFNVLLALTDLKSKVMCHCLFCQALRWKCGVL